MTRRHPGRRIEQPANRRKDRTNIVGTADVGAIEDRSPRPKRPGLVAAQLVGADPAEEIPLGERKGQARVDLVQRSCVVACAVVTNGRPVDALKAVVAQGIEAVRVSDSRADDEGGAREQPVGRAEKQAVVSLDSHELGEATQPRHVEARAVGGPRSRREPIVARVAAGRESKCAVALVTLQNLSEYRSGRTDPGVSLHPSLGIAIAKQPVRRVVFAQAVAQAQTETLLTLLEVVKVEFTQEQGRAGAELTPQKVRVADRKVVATGSPTDVDLEINTVAAPEKIGLTEGRRKNQLVLGRETGAKTKGARGALGNGDVQIELRGIIRGLGFKIDIFEETQAPYSQIADLQIASRVELPLDQLQFAPNYRVDRGRIAKQIDVSDEVQGPLLDLKFDVDFSGFCVESSSGPHACKIETPVGVVALQGLDILGQVRPVEDLPGLELQLRQQSVEIHRIVAADPDLADAELRPLPDHHANLQSIPGGVDFGLRQFHLEIADVAVLLFDPAQISQEDLLGVGSGLIEPTRQDRPRSPQLGNEVPAEFSITEGMIALERDDLEPLFVVFFDLEVHGHRTVDNAFDRKARCSQVVALGAIECFDPLGVRLE